MKRIIIYLIVLFNFSTFGLPLTINFQMVVKDDSGRPVSFNNENILFFFSGDLGITFWAEVKAFTSPNGILNTKLGDKTAIDPLSFYAQNSIKLTVTRANGDTLLSEPFNTVPYSFKSGFSDSAKNAYFLQGKVPADFLSASYSTTIRNMISDSIAAHPPQVPSQAISDSVSNARLVLRNEIKDTSSVLRGHSDSIVLSLNTALKNELVDSAFSIRNDAKKWISDSILTRNKFFWHELAPPDEDFASFPHQLSNKPFDNILVYVYVGLNANCEENIFLLSGDLTCCGFDEFLKRGTHFTSVSSSTDLQTYTLPTDTYSITFSNGNISIKTNIGTYRRFRIIVHDL